MELPEDVLRTLVAGLTVPPELPDRVAVVVLLPVREALEVAEPPLRTVVDGRVTLVTPLPAEADAVLRTAVPDEDRLDTVPADAFLTVVPDAPVVPDADADLLTEDVRTVPETPVPDTPAPETDEWELEASPPPVPLEP